MKPGARKEVWLAEAGGVRKREEEKRDKRDYVEIYRSVKDIPLLQLGN